MEGKNYKHYYRFRAETIVDVLSLRRSLYELEKAIGKNNNTSTLESNFKMGIMLTLEVPDIDVMLWTPYPIKFVKKAMQLVVDSHVMQDTLRELTEYTGERTYDAERLDMDLSEFWSEIQTYDDFFIRGIELNPSSLTTTLVPYLNAITEIQKIIDEIAGREFTEPRIHQILSGSAIISVEGLGDALRSIREFFRFRKAKAEVDILENQVAHGRVQILRSEIAKERDDIDLETAKKMALLETDETVLRKQKDARIEEILLKRRERLAQVRKIEAEAEGAELELKAKYLKVATEFAEPFFEATMSNQQKMEFVVRLIKPIMEIETSGLIMEMGRPDTLPEFSLRGVEIDEDDSPYSDHQDT